jgi:hypothetical protein
LRRSWKSPRSPLSPRSPRSFLSGRSPRSFRSPRSRCGYPPDCCCAGAADPGSAPLSPRENSPVVEMEGAGEAVAEGAPEGAGEDAGGGASAAALLRSDPLGADVGVSFCSRAGSRRRLLGSRGAAASLRTSPGASPPRSAGASAVVGSAPSPPPPSRSSRYGLSLASPPPDRLDGRPRPRRGGRRRGSFMPQIGSKGDSRSGCPLFVASLPRVTERNCPVTTQRDSLVRIRSHCAARRAKNLMYDGIKNRRDACSAVGIVGARTPHGLQRCWRYGAALDAWIRSLTLQRLRDRAPPS